MPESSLDLIRSIASRYPGAERAFLFGDHEVFRVRKKVFVWLGTNERGDIHVSVKLKDSQHAALMLPFVSPAGYGMSKWGWIAAEFPKDKLPRELVVQWIEESYRHTAPKALLKQLGSTGVEERRASPARRKRAHASTAPTTRKGRRRGTQSTTR